MNKISHTTFLFGASIILLVVAILAGFFSYDYIQKTGIKNAELAKNLAEYSRSGEESQKLEKLLETTKDAREALPTYFLVEDKIIEFIELLETTGKTLGVTAEIASLDEPKGEVKKGDITDVTVRMEVRGQWTNVLKYIETINRLPYALQLIRLNIRTGGGKGEWVANFQLVVKKIN